MSASEFLFKKFGLTSKGLLRFVIIATNAQFAYGMITTRETLAIPFMHGLGVDKGQLGWLLSLQGLTLILGAIPLGWLGDKFSIKNIMGFGIIGAGIFSALIVAFCPWANFMHLFIMFTIMFLFCEPVYWPTALKAVRIQTVPQKQATFFGLFEFGRGLTSFVIGLISIGIYGLLGGNAGGDTTNIHAIKVTMMVNAVLMIVSGILVLLIVPPDEELKNKDNKTKEVKEKASFAFIVKAMKMPEVWLTGLGALCVYVSVSAATNYFPMFLQEIYIIPVSLVAIFALFSNSLVRTITAPVSGFVTNWGFKTTAHWMRLCFIALTIGLAGIILLPRDPQYVVIAMLFLMIIFTACLLMRGIYYAPIGEMAIDPNMSASAMSVASSIGYLPQFLAPVVFGLLLQHYDDIGQKDAGYLIMFIVMIILAVCGIFTTSILSGRIIKRRQKLQSEAKI
jgi:MFS family permease